MLKRLSMPRNAEIRVLLYYLFVGCLLSMMMSFNVWAEKMRVLTEPLAPVHFVQDGQIQGIATDIVRHIFNEVNLDTEFEIYPWNRAYEMALRDKTCFIYTINRTPERESLFKWIGPILHKSVHLYKMRGRDDVVIESLADVREYTTAVILGHSLTKALLDEGFREGRELIITPNKKAQMKVFLKGRADLITGNQFTIFDALRTEGYTLEYVEPAYFVSSDGYYLAANPEISDNLVEEMNRANMRIQQSGLVEKIIIKYMY